MKKIILLALMISAALFSGAQTIPNPSFEDWATYSLGERPVSWNSSDSLTVAYFGGHSVVKEDSYVCDLQHSVKVTSRTLFTAPVPGVVTNGIITVVGAGYTLSGGSPDTARSKFISGCLKYIPASPGTDKAVISAFLFRWNGTSRDTVAFTIDSIETTLTMTNFNFGFNYLDYVNQPDTIFIIMQSSKGLQSATAGSELIVDNLALSGFVGINEPGSPVVSMQLYPMPANQEINVRAELSRNVSMRYEIMDISGKLLSTAKMQENSAKIDVSTLPSGNYFISLQDENGKKLCSDKFSIER